MYPYSSEDNKSNCECECDCCQIISAIISVIVLIIFLTSSRGNFKVRMSGVSLETLKYVVVNSSNPSNSPSFFMVINTEISFKNKNLFDAKVGASTATLSYRGMEVGKSSINNVKVDALSKEKVNITVSAGSDNKVSSKEFPQLSSDLNSKNLSFIFHAKMKAEPIGWLEFLKKSVTMNCSFVVDIGTKKISPFSCK